jgi:hypothetical protein
MKIFLLVGKAESGKDLLGSYMKTKYDFKGDSACILHITTPLYEYARNYFSWNGDMREKPREFLQEMGIEVIRNTLHKDTFLVDRLCEDVDILKHYFSTFIITDGRLVSEFNLLRERFPDIKIIHVIRDNYDNKLSEKERGHITETDMENYTNYDYVIKNTTKEEMFKEADKIMSMESETELL